jgi:hypothetical protein
MSPILPAHAQKRGGTNIGALQGVPSCRAPIRLAEIPSFRGAFVSSARGVAFVSEIDSLPLGTDPARVQAVADVYESLPGDSHECWPAPA